MSARRILTLRPRVSLANPQPLGVAGNWALALNDDFDGTAGAAPDLAKWNYGENFNALRWDAMVRAECARLDGLGNVQLIITNADIGHGVELSSGWLESNQQFGPGTYFEWRAKLKATSNGGHATVWTQTVNGMTTPGTSYPVPSDGCEVDVGEYAPGISNQTNIHSGGYTTFNHQSPSANGADPTLFHVYGLNWQPSGYTFYLDGVQIRTYSAFIGTNTDQVARVTIEHDAGAATECAMLCDYARVWTGS